MIITNFSQFTAGASTLLVGAVTALALLKGTNGFTTKKCLGVIASVGLAALGAYTCWLNSHHFVECNLNDVTFQNYRAKELVKTYCECPAAAKIINNIAAKELISIEVHESAPTRFAFIEGGTYIQVNQRHHLRDKAYQSCSALEALTFEIFNSQARYKRILVLKECFEGKISLDKYALQKGDAEFYPAKKRVLLVDQCQEVWKLNQKNTAGCTQLPSDTLEMFRFTNNVFGHNDYYKREWIDLCQPRYCWNFPSDASCALTKDDFFDYEAALNLPESEYIKIKIERFYQLFNTAPLEVQERIGHIWRHGQLCM